MATSLHSRLIRLLRWSERYTKTDMVYLAHGGFWSVFGQITASLTTLIFALVVSRYVPKSAYGEYKYILSIVAILSTLSFTGLGAAVFQSTARGFDGALQEGFWKNLKWSFVVFLGALSFAIYYFLLGNNGLAIGILIGGCFSPFLVSAGLSNSFLVAKKDFRRQTIYFGILANIIPAIALFVTIVLTRDPLALVATYFISNTLIAVYLYRRTVRLYAPDEQKTDPEMATYGAHLSVIGIITGIANNIDQILLFQFVGPVQVALYSFATAIPDQIKGPIKTIDTMIQVQFARRSDTEIHLGMHHKLFTLLVFYAAIAFLYIIFAPLIFNILFPNYVDAVLYSQIYAISMLAFSCTPLNSYFGAKKKISAGYMVGIISSIFQVAALLVGVIMGGLMGLVIARVCTRLFYGILTYSVYIWTQ